MKKLFFTLSIFLVITSSSFAQSQFLKKGENGIKAGLGFQTNDAPYTNLGFIFVGFGSSGKTNVTFQLGKGENFTIFSPSVDLFLLNGFRENKPISLGIILKTEYIRYENTTKNSFSYGGFLNIGNSSTRKSGILPFFTILRTNVNDVNLSTIGGGITIYNKNSSISTFDFGYYKTDDTYSFLLSIGSTVIR